MEVTNTKKPSILYVDDESTNLDVFLAQFRKLYNVYVTTSPYEAIEILKNNEISLIITDQRMPKMTGVQFLEAVIPEYPDPIRMILTGFSDIEAIKNAINEGAVLRYITKPWDQEELKQIIDMGIKMYELEKDQRKLVGDLQTLLTEQRNELELFEKYVPRHVFKQAVGAQKEMTVTEGEYRIISMLFADIRNFTHFSEKLEAKQVVDYLNRYFTIMINCVTKNHGYVYKLLGDGIIAIFGAPISSLNNQLNAVRCALSMANEGLQEFNQDPAHAPHPKATIGIGICTTEMIVGHVSSERFITYEAIGSAIETSQNIQAASKNLTNGILICEGTYQALQDDIEAEPFETTLEDGKKTTLYKVLRLKSL